MKITIEFDKATYNSRAVKTYNLRAVKLLQKNKFFVVVVAEDEPYFVDVYMVIWETEKATEG